MSGRVSGRVWDAEAARAQAGYGGRRDRAFAAAAAAAAAGLLLLRLRLLRLRGLRLLLQAVCTFSPLWETSVTALPLNDAFILTSELAKRWS